MVVEFTKTKTGSQIMRIPFLVLVALALAACQPTAVDRQRGVGFEDYTLYQQQRAYLDRPVSAAPTQPRIADAGPYAAPVQTATAAPAVPQTAPQSIAADTLAALGRGSAAPPAPAPAQLAPAAGAPLSAIGPAPAGAVSAPPAAAPAAPVGNNVVAYALSTTHPVGQQMHRRTNLFGTARFQRACAGYASDGLAQEAFLSRGGPDRDPLGLDPDGDGYACAWNPAPFRNIRN